MPRLEPDRLLDDLDPEQREAVLATSGPVAILAGAGTGKTRVISRRAAYAIATDVVPPDQALIVTFTDKAAGEMVDRLRSLGLPGVTARTFHAHALSQLRHFWPDRHGGQPLPGLLDSKIPIIGRLARQLPGHYRFTPAKDLADEIEWAKSRRIEPRDYERAVAREAPGREPPIPIDLFVRTFENYERAKARAGRIDFDDLLVETVRLLEGDVEAVDIIRARKRWFSVDEYQDTNPLQERLLELWLGDRRDLCVVGDVDQTIYTFTGATSGYLTTFADRHPGARVLDLTRNYRSTPEVLDLANRLVAADGRSKRLTASRASGPAPSVSPHMSEADELDGVVAGIRRRIADGVSPAEIAVLVRMNAQLEPVEAALTRAAIPYVVRGIGFYERPEVKAAIASLRRPGLVTAGPALVGAIRRRWAEDVGFEEDGTGAGAGVGREAQERQSALETLVEIAVAVVQANAAADVADVVAELERRAAHERETAASGDGVNLLTYHRAKGLEWDAVFLPMLEEGSLPIRQSLDDDAALAEERRLLYVGITRARVHLALSWAKRRETRGRDTRREPSRFLLDLRDRPAAAGRVRELAGPPPQPRRPRPGDDGDPLFAALRAWRTATAQAEGMPAYVVAHDSTLAAIAEARPASLSALRRVKGMGPAKLEKYGDGILEVLAAIE
jgi:DNA helicase-2/ATP-dependent DNA helicase PcrA